MKILLDSFLGNPNIGLFAFATDKICLVPKDASPTFVKNCSDVFNVKVEKVSIAGTSLIGIFCNGFENNILVPKITFDYEVTHLKKLGLNVIILDSDFTAFGNNMIMNDKIAVIGKDYDIKMANQLKKHLNIKVLRQSILEYNNIGSFIALNNKGGLVHPDISDKEKKWLEKTFSLPFQHATVNLGSPYIKSGILINNNGAIIGNMTRGMELSFIQEGLGFVEK
jgi:translation initiation factor 6